ncbi:outer membrane beta-barrel protein [Mangrovimonas sp. YM274]|uniref:outer membrane beta-barrel protein n=1 Tax=Mangrovimonas sp. YM274 TaxID=3070660 RepID=UPI0027DC1064|nr:outer membrane beta-barrel protein [Mangrovimonas sp. YM274]WMI70319.1 outer membrane beta-barrel protein [Mangrovimonas sp. YM274]
MLYTLPNPIKNKLGLFFILTFLWNAISYSQIEFEKGYFIDDAGTKTECLIKNSEWKYNPTDFKYKPTETSTIKTGKINSIKEFGIYNKVKFIKTVVDIDTSPVDIQNLDTKREPNFQKQELFLKVLLEGKATLYLHVEGLYRRYFFNIDQEPIAQLIHKEFRVSSNKINENNQFRQQLWNSLKCESLNFNTFKSLNYHKSDLIKLFTDYNHCHNSDSKIYKDKKKIDFFNLSLRPRINMSSLSIESKNSGYRNVEFDTKLSFGFGLEAEFVLPFNKNKWAIIVEPTYQYFKTDQTSETSEATGFAYGHVVTTVDYATLELPLGIRHYFFLNKNSKIFINGAFVFDLGINKSSIDYKINDTDLKHLDINTYMNMAFGAGYKLMDKFSLEIRYFTKREILAHYSFWSSEYQNISFIFGISIL